MVPKIKICGLTNLEAVNAAVKNKVDYISCVFYKYSPRNITPQFAESITEEIPNRIQKIAVLSTYESNIEDIIKYYKPEILQFHSDEEVDDILKIKSRFGLPIIKTIRVNKLEDLKVINKYSEIADMYLFESYSDNNLYIDKPGNKFDWSLLKKVKIDKPWFLSGSLDKYNVNYARRVSGAVMINASVTLESSPGIKDPNMIEDFIKSVRNPNY
ncbi:phosphoribosylanthranilate isomerase [Candidatus Jidaibacter acanthamoebae]|nr:phosphoribosylanthranilate isomerase [Candidatus Jidaibacter acanthamoeba]